METNNGHKGKIQKNKLIITKADKGKTLVILKQEECKHKIKNFIHDKKFMKSDKKRTQQYQKIVKQTLKQCNNVIQERQMEIHEHEPHSPKSTSYNRTINTTQQLDQ
jgi:hypothetical protein